MAAPRRDWRLAEIDDTKAGPLAAALSCSQTLARLLVQRGVTDDREAATFLDPSLHGLHGPEHIPDLDEAARLLASAVTARRVICIYGDYDVDGLSATALLTQMFRHLGARVMTYVPDRLVEGYGVNVEAVRRIRANGAEVLITVDGGSNDLDALREARALGMDVVVTDHHPVRELTGEFLLVHPARADRPSPFPQLAGVGVAYKLVWGIGKTLGGGSGRVTDAYRRFMLDALAYVALGTVADVVPLVGENRVLVRYGLLALERTAHPGLRALIASAGLTPQTITPEAIAFRLAPRLNAAGRLGRAQEALDLLLCDEPARAEELAVALERANRERKKIEDSMLRACEEQLAARGDLERGGPLVLAGEGWHAGVAGIVASRLVDRYRRPTFVIAIGDVARGSARTIEEFPLDPLYEVARRIARSAGGHSRAGGIVLAPADVPRLREALIAAASTCISPHGARPPLHLDLAVAGRDLNHALVADVARLAPFGAGNPTPCFRIDNVRLAGAPRLVGRGEEHLIFSVRGDTGAPVRAVCFGGAAWAAPIARTRAPFSLAAELTRGREGGMELRVLDVALAE